MSCVVENLHGIVEPNGLNSRQFVELLVDVDEAFGSTEFLLEQTGHDHGTRVDERIMRFVCHEGKKREKKCRSWPIFVCCQQTHAHTCRQKQ